MPAAPETPEFQDLIRGGLQRPTGMIRRMKFAAIDMRPEKRQVTISLGVLAYAGTARPGAELKFDAASGAWHLKPTSSGFWGGLRSVLPLALHPPARLPLLFSICGALLLLSALTISAWPTRAASSSNPAPPLTSRSEQPLADAFSKPLWLTTMLFSSVLQDGLVRSNQAVMGALAAPNDASALSSRPAPSRPASVARRQPPGPLRPPGPIANKNTDVLGEIREFSRPVSSASSSSSDVLVAILNNTTVVVPNPLGVPMPVRVGERLPSGATLLKIDVDTESALTTQGTLRPE